MIITNNNLTIFNFTLHEIMESILEPDYLMLDEAYDKSRIFGPYNKLLGTVVKYYFKTDKNNLYAVNFLRLSRKSYTVTFYFIKNITKIDSQEEMDDNIKQEKVNRKKGNFLDNFKNINPFTKNKNSKSTRRSSASMFNQLNKEEQFEVFRYVFESCIKFLKDYNPDSIWLEPSFSEEEILTTKNKKIKTKSKPTSKIDGVESGSDKEEEVQALKYAEGVDLFKDTKRGRIYKMMADKGVKGTNYDVVNDESMLVLYNKSKHKDPEKLIKNKPFAITLSYITMHIDHMTDNPPKEVYENLASLTLKHLKENGFNRRNYNSRV